MDARILIADDDETIIRLLTITLRNEGYELIIARDGRAALDMVNSEHPDMAILDVMMPEMTGFEVCHALRAQPETATMPVIILSGLSDVNDKASGLQAGADEYVTKPIDLRELAARVAGLLRRNRMLRESSAPKAGKIVAVWGAKGGVGATTTALNIATVLARANKSTIVVEMRPDFGTFSAQLKMRPERNLSAVAEQRTVGGYGADDDCFACHHPVQSARNFWPAARRGVCRVVGRVGRGGVGPA